jgi:protein-L-isoaspartate(D-aspartate) O-methyltransferase
VLRAVPFTAQKINLIMELRRGGITDRNILAVIETLPRERFVPAPFLDRAYENAALPIAHGQTISQPYTVAYMTQALEVGPRMKVLEIGTGSGYQAAVLARLCRRVYTIERYRTLLEEAERRFAALDIHNITTRYGPSRRRSSASWSPPPRRRCRRGSWNSWGRAGFWSPRWAMTGTR